MLSRYGRRIAWMGRAIKRCRPNGGGSAMAAAAALLLAGIGPAASAGCNGSRIALVIGNRSYPDADVPLKGTIEGAARVADALRSIGFDVQSGENLGKSATEAALRVFEAKIKPGTAAFLYFSGYGVQANGHTFLLPVDASIWSEADIATNGLNIDRVLAEIEERKAAVEVLVIDAARRNPYERRFRTAGSNGLAPPSAASGNLVALFSAAPDKVYDPRDTQADTFAEDVAREITAPHVTAQEAFRQVRSMVARTSQAGQTPWGFTTLSDDMALDSRDCSPGAGSRPAIAGVEGPAPTPPSPPAPQQPAIAAPAAQASPPPEKAVEQEGQARRFKITLRDNNLLDETRERLFDQGYDPGPIGSDAMRTAIVEFERKTGLPQSGQPTLGLLDALRSTNSPAPWGAIAVADDVKSWGMSWDQPTRSQALADAKSKCGTQRCTQAMSFAGHSCGAFALSARRWNVSNRGDGDAARKAALSGCGQTGVACRVIGSVCADGSDKTD